MTNSLPKVIVLDSALVPDSTECEIETSVLSQIADVQLLHVRNEEDFAAHAAGVRACIVWHHANLTRASLALMPHGSLLVRNGVGFDNIDIATAAEYGITVSNVPDYGTEEVADHAVTLMLALARRLTAACADVAAGKWDWTVVQGVRRLRDQHLGIIGCGRIGTAVAMRAKAFGMRVAFYDPYIPNGYEKALGVSRHHDLDALLAASDHVSIHVPLTAETRHLLDRRAISKMKPGAFLINTARGPVVDEAAVWEALERHWLAGAALDVVETEPTPHPALLGHPNCLTTPHCAFYSIESLDEMRRKAAMIVRDFLEGKPAANVVNRGNLFSTAANVNGAGVAARG
jgi:phosphoglycerate dehydrogenase-like enzyme